MVGIEKGIGEIGACIVERRHGIDLSLLYRPKIFKILRMVLILLGHKIEISRIQEYHLGIPGHDLFKIRLIKALYGSILRHVFRMDRIKDAELGVGA